MPDSLAAIHFAQCASRCVEKNSFIAHDGRKDASLGTRRQERKEAAAQGGWAFRQPR
jgi:hypothetical protein